MSTTRTRRTLPALSSLSAVLAAGVLVLGACSSDDSDDSAASDSPSATVTVTADPPDATVAPAPGGDGGNGSGSGGGSDDGSDDGAGDGDGGDAGDCSGLTAEEAVNRWASEVPLPEEGYPYAPGAATLETYEPCAALSWMVLPVANGTGSSPNQIMLFHHGEYIGTATEKAYGFTPDVIRVSDETISVTWHWPREGDADADPTGESTAQFTWDESTQSVGMTGEVPPE